MKIFIDYFLNYLQTEKLYFAPIFHTIKNIVILHNLIEHKCFLYKKTLIIVTNIFLIIFNSVLLSFKSEENTFLSYLKVLRVLKKIHYIVKKN